MAQRIPSNIEKVAVFSDIHSNYHAFLACYEDARSQGVQGFIFLGDYVSDLADPRKTLDLVYRIRSDYPTVCLRGNREGYMLECRDGTLDFTPGSKSGSLLYTYQALEPADLAFFAGLPIADTVTLFGQELEIAHAVRDNDRYYFDAGDGNIGPVFEAMTHSWLLTGHSHRQYRMTRQGKTVLNPGSVGVPHGQGNPAQYAILTGTGDIRCSFRQVPYDIRAMVCRQFDSGLVRMANCWAISVLYDSITGQEYTMTLLRQVAQQGRDALYKEEVWRRCAREMDMGFTPEELLRLCDLYPCGF